MASTFAVRTHARARTMPTRNARSTAVTVTTSMSWPGGRRIKLFRCNDRAARPSEMTNRRAGQRRARRQKAGGAATSGPTHPLSTIRSTRATPGVAYAADDGRLVCGVGVVGGSARAATGVRARATARRSAIRTNTTRVPAAALRAHLAEHDPRECHGSQVEAGDADRERDVHVLLVLAHHVDRLLERALATPPAACPAPAAARRRGGGARGNGGGARRRRRGYRAGEGTGRCVW